MCEPSASLPLAAQDAEALIALGLPVVPHGPDMADWRVGCLIRTDAELMGLAARLRVHPSDGPMQ